MIGPFASFTDVLDSARLISFDVQLQLHQYLGFAGTAEVTRDIGLSRGRCGFFGPNGVVSARAHFLGEAAPASQAWLWGWRRIILYPLEVTALAERCRDFGQEHGIPELAKDTHKLHGEDPGTFAERYAMAASHICGNIPFYTASNGKIPTVAAMLLEPEGFELPPLDPDRLRTVIAGVAERGEVTDWQRALASYAEFRGLLLSEVPAADQPGCRFLLSGQRIQVYVTMDATGRLAEFRSVG